MVSGKGKWKNASHKTLFDEWGVLPYSLLLSTLHHLTASSIMAPHPTPHTPLPPASCSTTLTAPQHCPMSLGHIFKIPGIQFLLESQLSSHR